MSALSPSDNATMISEQSAAAQGINTDSINVIRNIRHYGLFSGRIPALLAMVFSFFLLSNCADKQSYDQRAGDLRLAVDQTGKITVLQDVSDGTNYTASHEASYLLVCQKYGPDTDTTVLQPQSMQIVEQNGSETVLDLLYPEGIRVTVGIVAEPDYFRMEVVDADPVSEISAITWGPYNTTMRGHIGEWVGLNRSDRFTIGLMGLEPNTDGLSLNAATYTPDGSALHLVSYDHTRGRFVPFFLERPAHLRKSEPIPGLTVIGSSVALFGCPAGRDDELGIIEKIELNEGLPHPTFDGQWNKYSNEGQKFCIWAYYNEESFDDYLQLSEELSARILCRPGGFSSNWGHFDINPRIYPGGVDAIREDSREAKGEGIGLTLYTLTTFLKPNPDPEPYLSPIPDERLQTWRPETALAKDLGEKEGELILDKSEEVLAVLAAAGNKVIRVNDELIEFKAFSVHENRITASGCERGAFHTRAADHAEGSRVRLMYVAGYHNFYPGTLDLSNEFSARLSDMVVKTEVENFVVDGYESCMETGYGSYTGNVFLKNFYDVCLQQQKEVLVTTSMMTQYSWHVFSHISWGEGDRERGVRGTMLDYRLFRQMQLNRNLMPRKLGQYYPTDATAEDVNWIMAIGTGWDSGVDFLLNAEGLRQNSEYEEIVGTLDRWEKARAENAFSEAQKMALRQTDVLYTLSQEASGQWNLEFDRFWQNEKLSTLPSSAMNATAVDGGKESVRPCSIDWSWTHNPGLYDEVGLSDDLIGRANGEPVSWTVDYPDYTELETSWYPTSDRHFQCIIRLPEDAPCAVKNFKVSLGEKTVVIPAVLHPGQYISIPHVLEWACVYNKDHHVVGEVWLHGYLPKVHKGETIRISLTSESADDAFNPEVILNVRCQNGYFYQ
jgi:hypothetical protein